MTKKIWVQFKDMESYRENEVRLCTLLREAPRCPAAVAAFYDRYKEQITGIKTVQERIGILSDMQQDFETEIRQEPQNRDKLSEVYQLLKRRCWEIG